MAIKLYAIISFIWFILLYDNVKMEYNNKEVYNKNLINIMIIYVSLTWIISIPYYFLRRAK